MPDLTGLSLEPFRGDFEGPVNLYSWTFNPEISLSKVRKCNEILV
jgi:hypothetical protein